MINNPLVSIIIPTYNRAHLIGETIESICNQTYSHWECIIVDDGSTDNTATVIQDYLNKDSRFLYVPRPKHMPKGANACRNFGFENSKGEYINWFDSDDIMEPRHIEVLLQATQQQHVDFAVGDTQNFSEENKNLGKPYNFDRTTTIINATSFGKQAIGWITDDFLCKKESIQNIRFNERFITDGDEYNFFTQLLHLNLKGVFVNQILTLRRLHPDALTQQIDPESPEYLSKVATIKYRTFVDIKKYDNLSLQQWFLSGYMQYSFRLAIARKKIPYFLKGFGAITSYISITNALAYLCALISAYLFGKGYLFLKKAIHI